MPAPVDSRSSLTIAAEIVVIIAYPSCLSRHERGACLAPCRHQLQGCRIREIKPVAE
jgi:hypothetical protein